MNVAAHEWMRCEPQWVGAPAEMVEAHGRRFKPLVYRLPRAGEWAADCLDGVWRVKRVREDWRLLECWILREVSG